MNSYGKELILDLHDCDPDTYLLRQDIEDFIEKLCVLMKVERADLHWWDYAGYPRDYEAAPDRIKGVSVVQFILTSTIVIHTLDVYKRVYLNAFSCDDFDAFAATELAVKWCKGTVKTREIVVRK